MVRSATKAQINFEAYRSLALSYVMEGICRDKSVTTPIDSEVEDVAKVLTLMGEWSYGLDGALGDIIQTLNSTEHTLTNEVVEVIENVESQKAIITWIIIIMLLFACGLFAGGCLAWFTPSSFQYFFCLQGWVILPLFMLTLCGSVVLASLCGMVLVLNSGKGDNYHNNVYYIVCQKMSLCSILTTFVYFVCNF